MDSPAFSTLGNYYSESGFAVSLVLQVIWYHRETEAPKSSLAIVIVRAPSSIVCLRLYNIGITVFVIFTPQPSPDHPDGPGLAFSTSLEQTTRRLCNILSTDNERLSQSSSLQWQARLLSNCTSYTFVSRESASTSRNSEDTLMVSSLSIFTLQAERAELYRQSQALLAKGQSLEQKVSALQRDLQVEKEKGTKHRDHGRVIGEFRRGLEEKGKRAEKYVDQNRLVLKSNIKPVQGHEPGYRLPPMNHSNNAASTSEDRDPHYDFAFQLQRAFDLEDRDLFAQRNALLASAQRQYHCGVCLDDFPEDDAVRIDSCGHGICRDCARGHVCSKIDEHRFPVLCPVCTVDRGNRRPGGVYDHLLWCFWYLHMHVGLPVISGLLVELLGVTEGQYATWIEMEMAQFSVLINCRKSASICIRLLLVTDH